MDGWDCHEFMDEVRRGSTEDASDFMASLVKSHLEGVYVRGLAHVCEPSFSAISKDGNNNRDDNTPPRN